MKILDYEGLKQLTNKIKEKLNEKLTTNNLFEQAIESKTKGSTTLSAELKKIEDKVALKATQSEAETGTNDTKYMTPQSTKQAILKLAPEPDLSGYVQKDGTKVLSTNDYTSAEKQKLSGIATGANKTRIINNLTSGGSTAALSAEQGKVLNNSKIDKSTIATGQSSTPMLYQAVVMKTGADTSNVPDGTVIYFIE